MTGSVELFAVTKARKTDLWFLLTCYNA